MRQPSRAPKGWKRCTAGGAESRLHLRLNMMPLCLLAGCSVPITGGLDDSEANRVVVALEGERVEATKEPDPAAEGKWRVDVAHDDISRALSVLRDEGLPRSPTPGVLDAI